MHPYIEFLLHWQEGNILFEKFYTINFDGNAYSLEQNFDIFQKFSVSISICYTKYSAFIAKDSAPSTKFQKRQSSNSNKKK